MEKIINKKNNYIKYKIINNLEKNKIISISGVNEKIKAILILLILNYYKKDKKILIINMDFLNNYLVNNLYKQKNNFYYLDGRRIIFQKNDFNKYIEKFKNQFDIIIINTSYESFLKYNKKLVELSNINYFLIKYNKNELNKSINLYKIYKNKWKIKENKIEILINN